MQRFKRKVIHYVGSVLIAGACVLTVVAADAPTFDIAEFNKILDSINSANIPENIKDQLYRDVKNSMIENVKQAKIPDDVKRVLVRDLQNTPRR